MYICMCICSNLQVGLVGEQEICDVGQKTQDLGRGAGQTGCWDSKDL